MQVVDTPGASEVAGQVMPVALGSLTVSELSVVAPAFFTTNEYGTEVPSPEYDVDVDDFVMVSADIKGALVSVQVMLSPPTGVTLKGTAEEPEAGSTVAEPEAVLTQVTDCPY